MAKASNDLHKAVLKNLIELCKKAHKKNDKQTPLAKIAKDFVRPTLTNWSDLLEIHDIVKHFIHALDTMPEHSKDKFPGKDEQAWAAESMHAIKSHFKVGQVPKALCFCAGLPEIWNPKKNPSKSRSSW